MIRTKILFVFDLVYANPDEIAYAKNGKEIADQYLGQKEIPVRILELGDKRNCSFIILAGDGALYPWKKGQMVEASLCLGIIWHIEFNRELCIQGENMGKYENFCLYNSVKPIRTGQYYPDKDAVAYNGIASLEMYRDLANAKEELFTL
jgi:hypothetical protein